MRIFSIVVSGCNNCPGAVGDTGDLTHKKNRCGVALNTLGWRMFRDNEHSLTPTCPNWDKTTETASAAVSAH